MNEKIRKKILDSQRNEISEYQIYKKLSESTDDPHNKEVLRKIGEEEREHHDFWKDYTETDVEPKRFKIWFYYSITLSLKFLD